MRMEMSPYRLLPMLFLIQYFYQAEALYISSMFLNGSLKFTWENMSQKYDPVYITTNKAVGGWDKIYNRTYLVHDVLKYKFVTITVFETSTRIRHHYTHKVSKMECMFSKNVIMSMPVENRSCSYGIYHVRWMENKMITKPVFLIEKDEMKMDDSSKYQDISHCGDSNISMFNIKDVTHKDAGLYVLGSNLSDALSQAGVVLIVHKKPLTPNISGNVKAEVGTSCKLTCSSELNSFPAYYSKLLTLMYNWFVNGTKLNGMTTEILTINITRKSKYDHYSCTARETVESNMSTVVKIDPLYGPDAIRFDPQPNQLNKKFLVTLREKDSFGPYQCLADCNPPCKITWKYKDTNGFVDAASIIGRLLSLKVKRDMILFQCTAEGDFGKAVQSSIYLQVKYLEFPTLNVYKNNGIKLNTINIREDTPLTISCYVDGNPTPRIRISKIHNNRDIVLSESTTHWSNYSFEREVTCYDTGVYVCSAFIEGLEQKRKELALNILCDPRYKGGDRFDMYDGGLIGLGGTIIIKLPVTSNPPPLASNITWIGPESQKLDVRSVVLQQKKTDILKHIIISIVKVPENGKYGEYRVLYNSFCLVNFTIDIEDLNMILFTGLNNDSDNVSKMGFLVSTVLSSLFGLIILSVALHFFCSKRKQTERSDQEIYMETPVCETWTSEANYENVNTLEDIHCYSTLGDSV